MTILKGIDKSLEIDQTWGLLKLNLFITWILNLFGCKRKHKVQKLFDQCEEVTENHADLKSILKINKLESELREIKSSLGLISKKRYKDDLESGKDNKDSNDN